VNADGCNDSRAGVLLSDSEVCFVMWGHYGILTEGGMCDFVYRNDNIVQSETKQLTLVNTLS
jgi:hypothetical protein